MQTKRFFECFVLTSLGFFLKHLFPGFDMNNSEKGFSPEVFFLELLVVPPCR